MPFKTLQIDNLAFMNRVHNSFEQFVFGRQQQQRKKRQKKSVKEKQKQKKTMGEEEDVEVCSETTTTVVWENRNKTEKWSTYVFENTSHIGCD